MFGGLLAPQAQPFVLAAEVVHLGLEADGVVLQPGRLAHLLQVIRLVGLDLMVQLAQPDNGRPASSCSSC